MSDQGLSKPQHQVGKGSWRTWLATRLSGIGRPFAFLMTIADLLAEAIPIGLLRRSDITAVTYAAYAAVPDFYDPARYSIRYEAELLPVLDNLTCDRRLLDLYCGHGREAEIFAEAGYDVFGVDSQASVIQRARAYIEGKDLSVDFTVSDIDQWSPHRCDWGVIYTSLWMYSTLPDRSARITWLNRLSGWLAPNGVLIISTLPRSSNKRTRWRHRIASCVAACTFNSRRVEYGDQFRTGLFWHDFSIDEVEHELRVAGLTVVDQIHINGATPCHLFVLREPARTDPTSSPPE